MLRETAVQERVRERARWQQSRAPQRNARHSANGTATQRTSPQDTATHVDVDFFICLIRVDAIINLKYGKDTRTHAHSHTQTCTRIRSRAHMHTRAHVIMLSHRHTHTHTHAHTQPHTCTYRRICVSLVNRDKSLLRVIWATCFTSGVNVAAGKNQNQHIRTYTQRHRSIQTQTHK